MYSLASRRASTCNSSCRPAQPEGHLLPCREVGLCSPSGRGRLCGGSGVATAPLASRCIAPRAGASHAHAVNTTACPAAPVAALHEAAASGRVGIVIVDHGSRKAESNMQLAEFAQLFQQMTGAPVVECAHMEIAKPSIEDAIGKCVAQGVQTVVIAPYFLSRGRHIQEDIPQLVREAQEKHTGVSCIVADPIGIDPLMAQLICNRVNAVVQAKAV